MSLSASFSGASEAGTAVVVVTHDLRLRAMMDRIFLMEDGFLTEAAVPKTAAVAGTPKEN